jgi:hypothetical protein
MEFFDWTMLGTYAGAIMAVSVITEIIEDIPGIKRIPTQLMSYVLAFIVLICAMFFSGSFTVEGAGLAAINAALVSLGANGGYEAVQRVKEATKKTVDN